MSDLKEIIKLLPKIVEGRELALNFDKSNHLWYVGHPNKDGDFSIGMYGSERDIEGAALSLLSQLDALKIASTNQSNKDESL